jgi:cytosine/adenosine deaminase-related metal-dependent hydrolase
MNTFVRCGSLFTGREDEAQQGGALVFDGEGRLLYAGAEAGAPRRAKSDRALDYSGCFVMSGLIDVHTHLAYGNAKS